MDSGRDQQCCSGIPGPLGGTTPRCCCFVPHCSFFSPTLPLSLLCPFWWLLGSSLSREGWGILWEESYREVQGSRDPWVRLDQDGAVPGQDWVELHFPGVRETFAVLWRQGIDGGQRRLGRCSIVLRPFIIQFPCPGKNRPVSNLAFTRLNRHCLPSEYTQALPPSKALTSG